MSMAQTPLWEERLTDGYIHVHEDLASDWTTCVVGEILHPKSRVDFENWALYRNHDKLTEYGTDFALAVEHDHHDIAWDRLEAIQQYLTPERIADFKKFTGS